MGSISQVSDTRPTVPALRRPPDDPGDDLRVRPLCYTWAGDGDLWATPAGPEMTAGLLVAITPPGAAGPPPAPTTSTTLDEHTPTSLKVGANTDSSDFFGIFIALAVLVGAIIVIRLAFPSRRRPPSGASAARAEANRRARATAAAEAAETQAAETQAAAPHEQPGLAEDTPEEPPSGNPAP